MKIVNELTDDAILYELANRLTVLRIGLRMTQDELARRSGVSKRSVERLEKGEGGVRLQIVIAVARALRCLGGLDAFAPTAPLSPYDITDKPRKPVQRVRKRNVPDSPFQWRE